jgi:hypothetical protein
LVAGSQSVASAIALIFSLTGRSQTAITLLLVTLMISIPAVSLFVTGLGIALGVGSLAGFYLIATLGLDAQRANRFTWPIIISSVLNVILDFFIPTARITISLISIVVPTLTVLVVSIFGVSYLRNFTNYPLRTKLIIAFTIVTIIPLGIFSFILNTNTRNILTEQTTADLTELSTLTAQNTDDFITTQLDILRTEVSSLPSLNF